MVFLLRYIHGMRHFVVGGHHVTKELTLYRLECDKQCRKCACIIDRQSDYSTIVEGGTLEFAVNVNVVLSSGDIFAHSDILHWSDRVG